MTRSRPVITSLGLALVLLVSTTESQVHLSNFTSYSVTGKTVTVWADTARIRFVFFADDIVRVDFLPTPTSVLDSSFVVIRDTSDPVSLSVQETDTQLILVTSSVTIVCVKIPLRLQFFRAIGTPLLYEDSSGGFTSDGIKRSVTLHPATDDHFYGTGERGTSLDKRGQTFDSYNDTFFGYDSPLSRMNINVPFLASSGGYALLFENTYEGHFDIGVTDPSAFSYTADAGELSYFLIIANTIPQQLERYVWLTGRQPLPPRWAFGYIQSKFGYQNETDATSTVQMLRADQIPCDAIVLDLYWFNQMGDLAWNGTAWPSPSSMITAFLRQGIKTVVITEPYVTSLSSNYNEGSSLGYFGKTSGGETYSLSNWWSCGCPAALVDMTSPAAQSWWWSKHPGFLGNDSGAVAGLWTDLGEPERHPTDMQQFLGTTAKVHNIYNLLWAKTVYDGLTTLRPNHRVFNLTRSGYAGIQRYGVIPWSADVGNTFSGLSVQLPMLLTMGVSALAYHNSDIGGFCCGATTPELYVRWIQFGAFSPVMRAHGTGRATEPWGYGTEAESISRSFIELRYRLLPYIYTMAHENYLTGMPLARPLFFTDPTVPSLTSESSSYLWGNDFLVSPVTVAGETMHDVRLPRGSSWIDYWTGQQYAGGQSIQVPASLQVTPLFVRAGSIIPMQPLMQYSDERPLDTLILAVYPTEGVAGSSSLYEDDGKTLAYQTGACATTSFQEHFSGQGTDGSLALSISSTAGTYEGKPVRRTYLAQIHNLERSPDGVTENGIQIPRCASYAVLRSNPQGFYVDSLARVLYIQTTTNPDSAYTITANGVTLTSLAHDQRTVSGFTLEQNYPNPFNPSTMIQYTVAGARGQGLGASEVRMVIYDVLGRAVATLVNARQAAGSYEVKFDGSQLASGIYFYRLSAGGFTSVRKMTLVK